MLSARALLVSAIIAVAALPSMSGMTLVPCVSESSELTSAPEAAPEAAPTAPPSVFPPLSDPPPNGSLDPKSNSLALIYGAYRDSGWAPEHAIAIAHRAMNLHYPDVTLPEPPPQGSLDPKSNSLAILYGLYRDSGWSPEQANAIAHRALGLEPAEGESTCGAYKVYITYCRGGAEQQLVLNMNSLCYEDPDENPLTADGLDLCDTISCLNGLYRWLSLTVTGTSCTSLPISGTCIQMRVEKPALPVNCDEIEVQCAWFAETTPTVNCAAIEQCCCSSFALGCTGCPTCTPPCP